MTLNRLFPSTVAAICVPLMVISAAIGAEPTSQKLPEYHFDVGQELVYSGESGMTYEGGTLQTLSHWQFFVMEKKSDGTWELLLRHASMFKQIPKEEDLEQAKAKMKEAIDDPDEKSVVRNFDRLTIDRYGRIQGLSAIAEVYAQVTHLFTGLPKSQKEAKDGWTVLDKTFDVNFVCQSGQADSATEFVVKSSVQSSQNTVFEIDEEITSTFDRDAGHPRRIVTKSIQQYAPKGESTKTVELVDVKLHSADWAATCVKETAHCDSIIQHHQTIVDNRDLDPTQLDEQLQKNREKLEELANSLTTNELKAAMMDLASKWKLHQEYHVRSARERAEMIGTKSTGWETKDLAGNDVSLSDFAGKVVVMDFWYRGCGWCIVAMPQVKAIADHFQDQPVVILGMNKDSEVSDANFVIKKLNLKYPNLEAEKIANDYKIQGFPTLLILDQKGTIRDVHVGYSPTLKRDVIRSVEKLLTAAP